MPSSLGPPRLPSGSPAAAPEDPEAARLRFRGFSYEEAAGPPEALARLRELCRQWLRPEASSKEQMLELLVLEQFLGALPPEIQAWVQGQRPGSPEEAAALVESLRQDPGQLLGWIAARVLKPAGLPAAQKAEDSLESAQPLGAAAGERPEDAPGETEGSAQLRCSVKKEPDADGLEPASASPPHPVQPQEEPVGPGEPDSASLHAPRMQEEWGLLDPSQKELYWDVMLEKYGSEVSQGLPPPLPDSRAEVELEPGSPSAGAEDPGAERQGPPAPEPDARSPRFTCEQCGRGFDWKSVFVVHHRAHRAAPAAAQPPPGPREPAAPRAAPSARRAPPARGYTCAECGRGFSWKSQLVIHRKGHAARPRHVCGDCGRGFDWKSQLVIHRRGHRPRDP